MRNTPLLLQLLFWYNAVLKALPGPKQSLSLAGVVLLNNRGLYLPRPIFSPPASAVLAALIVGVFMSFVFVRWARKRQDETGEQAPVFSMCAALIILPPVLAYFFAGRPIAFNYATLAGFNLKGGVQVFPEFAAMVFGLVTYTAGFIAENVRAGILAVSHGQHEAAARARLETWAGDEFDRGAAGAQTHRPAADVSQCLNIVKNSSLAVFIGYPDLVLIFAGTVLNQTHAAVQVMAITMGVYLVISLVISFALNIFNARFALERTLMSEGFPVAYVRKNSEPEEPPPLFSRGALAWLSANLFSSRFSSAITIVFIALGLYLISPLVEWATVKAVWFRADGALCRQHQDGACWAFIWELHLGLGDQDPFVGLARLEGDVSLHLVKFRLRLPLLG